MTVAREPLGFDLRLEIKRDRAEPRLNELDLAAEVGRLGLPGAGRETVLPSVVAVGIASRRAMTASALLFRAISVSRDSAGSVRQSAEPTGSDTACRVTRSLSRPLDRIEAAFRTIEINFNRGRKGIVGSGGLEPTSVGSAHRIADGWDHDSSGEG